MLEAEVFYVDFLHITEERLAAELVEITNPIQLRKGEILIHEGEAQDHYVFLTDGILRGFFLDANRRDVTDCFGYQCGTPGMSCFINNAPSPISIEALTACDMLQIPCDALLSLMRKEPQLLWIYNGLLQAALQSHWAIKTMVCQHTAMERYQWFLEAYPGLIDRVSNKHIASFLGMTPVTLSRLRRVLREKEQQEKQCCVL